MHNQPYAIERFLNNFSKNNTINEAIDLIKKDSKVDLTIHLESTLPISLCWDAKSDTFTGHQKITIFPKLVINGDLYESSFKHDLVMPMNGFDGLEAAFMKTLKQSIGTAQRVWE